jgi:hypothetical protein
MVRSVFGVVRARQQGVAVLVLVALLLLGGFMFALGTVKLTATAVERDRSSIDVLARAKGALIDAAVSDNSRPGQLPCPDVNDDGESTSGVDFVAATGQCMNLIGRLPWKTLGLPDLRDDSGERLWYAVSEDFRASNALALNSDTAFRAGNLSLTLNGLTSGSNLAAIVIAPGAVLKRSDGHSQVRACGAACVPIDFLDIAAGEDNADANRIFVSAQRSDTFNDRLMPVYSDDIMRLVERRAAREFAVHLRNHYDAWDTTAVVGGVNKGFYPYAAAYGDPYTAQVGTNGTAAGLLPVATTPLTWSNASLGCAGNGTATLTCNAVVVCIIVCLPTLSGQIDNVGTRFVDPPTAANVQVLLGLALGGSATWTMNKPARRLDFSYGGFIAAGVIQIQVSAPQASSWMASSWLITNNWHQSAYYALSSGYAIDGAHTCGALPPGCLTIANTSAPNSDKHAVVMVSGRRLASAAQAMRPVATPVGLGEYFEGLNADGTLTQFEANARTLTFNDTLVAVRP